MSAEALRPSFVLPAVRVTADGFAHAAGVVVPAGVALLWSATVLGTDLSHMGDLGLAPLLPAGVLAAIGILCASFCVQLRTGRMRTVVGVAHVAALVLILYGTPIVLEAVPRLNVTWRHAGIADQLARTGHIDRTIDAYFNWPGFFALVATISSLAGLDHPMQLAPWASVYFNLLYLAPLLVIARSLVPAPRTQWLAVWLFYLGNWINQDYFAPQAEALFLFLVIVALGVRYLSPGTETSPRERAAAVLISVALMAAMVTTHQLTPLAAFAAAGALVLVNRSRALGLPVIFAVMVVAWVSVMTEPFLAGRIHELLAGIGDVGRSANANVAERLQGSDEHLLIVRIRLLMTGGLWALALFGAVRVVRTHRNLALPALAAAPFPLLAFQPYGGEMLLRVYLFALPFAAALAAVALLPGRLGRVRSVALFTAMMLMVGGFLFSRYGNERINTFTEGEVRAIDRLVDRTPQGGVLVAATANLPWRGTAYADHHYVVLSRVESVRGHALPRIEDLLSVVEGRPPGCAHVLFTTSQRAYAELLGVWPAGAIERLESQMRRSPLFELEMETRDVVAFKPSRRLTDEPTTDRSDPCNTRGLEDA